MLFYHSRGTSSRRVFLAASRDWGLNRSLTTTTATIVMATMGTRREDEGEGGKKPPRGSEVPA
jgi:hypothetical protein